MSIPNRQAAANDIVSTRARRKFYVDDDFNAKDYINLVESHIMQVTLYDRLYDYYKGNHTAILSRSFDDKTKPNNKTVNNFCSLIVDTSTSYLSGRPVTYRGDKSTVKAITEVMEANNVRDVDYEESKLSAIMGHCFEIHWIDSNANHRFKQVSPRNCLIGYSMDIEEVPLVAIHYTTYVDLEGGHHRRCTIYTETSVVKMNYMLDTAVVNDTKYPIKKYEETEHYFGELPVIEIVANDERLGDFESVIGLVDAYNLAQSDSINDIQYMNDSYLWLKGFTLTEQEDINAMKNNKVMITEADSSDSKTDIKWLTKDVNDKHIENIKKRLREDIFAFSNTPDISGDNFASSSGVAVKQRMLSLENKSALKQTKMTIAMEKRFELIVHTLNLKKSLRLNPRDIAPVFVRNVPASLTEVSDMIVKLKGTVSDETLIAQLGFIPDPASEVVKARREAEDAMIRMAGVNIKTGLVNGTNQASENKLDNDQSKNTSTTMSTTAQKAQEKVRNKKPIQQEKAK